MRFPKTESSAVSGSGQEWSLVSGHPWNWSVVSGYWTVLRGTVDGGLVLRSLDRGGHGHGSTSNGNLNSLANRQVVINNTITHQAIVNVREVIRDLDETEVRSTAKVPRRRVVFLLCSWLC